ncbi:MAG: glycosyltransferase family 4 protein [Phycisphaerales bacterium]|jgi:glycosyltransferase involved in cell wall biosynthesis|nr:glycosyltransferase family 4 protein [Phycisphaerales bacterium]MBT7170559.1 glycosyltransferase family 4 protein [Phycisphaerales bacterium]
MTLLLACYDDLHRGGGAPRRAMRIGSALAARGHDVHILSKTAQPENDYTSQHINGCHVHWYVAPLGRLWRIPSLVRERALYRSLRHRGIPQPTWALSFSPFLDRPLRKLYPSAKIAYLFPCLLSNHTPRNTLRERIDALLLERIERRTIQSADALILQSSILQQEVDAFCPISSKRVCIIPPGIESAPPARTRAVVRQELNTGDSSMVCLVASRLDDNKNIEHILQSARILKGDIVFWVAGTGPQAHALQALCDEHGLGARVRLLGYRNDMNDLRHAADVFVHAAYYDAYPQVLLEALQAGLIPVAPKHAPPHVTSSAEEIYPVNVGYHYDLDDPSALTKVLQYLANQPALRSGMSAMASTLAETRYSLDRYAQDIETELLS